jgi:hypothetical protein
MDEFQIMINYINNNKIFVLFILITIHFIYIKTNIGTNEHFKTLISIYGSLGLILTIYSIYNTSKVNYVNTINNELTYLNQLFQNITQVTSTFFLNNKNMNYYYDELFNDKINSNNSIRDINLEQILTNNILINIDALVNYIDSFKITNGSNFQLKIMEEKLLKLLAQFMKSKIFVENWKKFRKSLALKWTKNYIELYFNK